MSTPEYKKNWREKMEKSHRCTRCGKQDSRTLSGKVICERCLIKRRAYYAKSKHRKKKINTGNSNFFKIDEIVTLASTEGLSYGQYVIKHRSN